MVAMVLALRVSWPWRGSRGQWSFLLSFLPYTLSFLTSVRPYIPSFLTSLPSYLTPTSYIPSFLTSVRPYIPSLHPCHPYIHPYTPSSLVSLAPLPSVYPFLPSLNPFLPYITSFRVSLPSCIECPFPSLHTLSVVCPFLH